MLWISLSLLPILQIQETEIKLKEKGEKYKFYWYFHTWFHSLALAKEGDPYCAIGSLITYIGS